MRKTITALAVAFTTFGLLFGMGPASASLASTSMGRANLEPVMYGTENASTAFGWYQGEVRPGSIYFGTGGDRNIAEIQWPQWNAARAYGVGTLYERTCWGDCFNGTRTTVRIALWRVRIHAGHPYYSRMIVCSNDRTQDGVYSYSTYGGGTAHEAFWH